MIKERLDQIEKKLHAADELADDLREQLLEKLEELKAELKSEKAASFDPESLGSLVGFTQLSAHEALRPQQDPELLKLALKGVDRNLERFETDHPTLVSVVNNFCIMLANMGI
ncbi:MAG: hypothetical protein DRQ60_08810 [Gammaproteobacteria bacterium]|nr:MAG: hypothetical protein DRQ54_10075 [Gammaproteobacteria bacterium]RLA11669.1 MAG: hypothetical protein DRQ52_09200 [Gammaproteobacteria bacterium]RLA12331.1 MAG: hypothetical protein DRQ60_08810 [Gammaproteobacteria bacterium]